MNGRAAAADDGARLAGLRALCGAASRVVSGALLLLIALYQRTVAPVLGECCRFSPSCSRYAEQCLRRHGLLKGVAKTTWRLLRCQPFGRGGYDPP